MGGGGGDDRPRDSAGAYIDLHMVICFQERLGRGGGGGTRILLLV